MSLPGNSNRLISMGPNMDMTPPRAAEMADRRDRARRGSLFETQADRRGINLNNNNHVPLLQVAKTFNDKEIPFRPE